MKLSKIRELEIAKKTFDISKKCSESLDYANWIHFVETNGLIWKENTEEGKKTLDNVDSIPESFRTRVVLSLSKRTACFDWNEKKQGYRILFTFRSEFNYVGITIEDKLLEKDFKLLLKMAEHLDALLLKDGRTIIDEKVLSESI